MIKFERRSPLILIVLVSSLWLASLPSDAAALNTPGAKCAKVGVVAKSGAVNVKCTKTGMQLSWQRIRVAGVRHWTVQGPMGAGWYSVASSSDGTKLIAFDLGGGGMGAPRIPGHIFTSTDSGITWTTHPNLPNQIARATPSPPFRFRRR